MAQGQVEKLVRKLKVGREGWQAEGVLDMISTRVKLKRYQVDSRAGLADLGDYLLALAREKGCGKVLAEVKEADWEQFLGRGFTLEGIIPGYFAGETAYWLSYFVDPARQHSARLEQEHHVLETVLTEEHAPPPVLAAEFQLSRPTQDDAEDLANLYGQVFTTYPSPLNDPEYVREQMESEEAIFRFVRHEGRIISAAAAEVDWSHRNAEMTNCATVPGYRGKGLMAAMMYDLQAEMAEREIGCCFSLARASSHGMNLVLRRLGYRFRGRLINNSHIMGGLEDMNIWVRV